VSATEGSLTTHRPAGGALAIQLMTCPTWPLSFWPAADWRPKMRTLQGSGWGVGVSGLLW
jgi:hypothetical protein